MMHKFFDKKSGGSGFKSTQNQQLQKLIIRKFKRCKVYTSFKYNIWGADLADMQLLIKYKKDLDLHNMSSIF